MKYYGNKVGNGLGIGKCIIINEQLPKVSTDKIDIHSINKELLKVNNTIDNCIKSYTENEKYITDNDLKILCQFNKIVLMAKSLKINIEKYIKENNYNGAYAISKYFDNKIEELNKSTNNYLKERVTDIKDIKNKVLKEYFDIKSFNLNLVKEDCILVSHEITLNILLSGNVKKIKGIISSLGGKTSHVGILSNSLGIPSVFGIKDCENIFINDELLFVNGNKGFVENELDKKYIIQINELIKNNEILSNEIKLMQNKLAYTMDNKYFEVCINSGDITELDKLNFNISDGIGLFRTEFLYLNKQTPPTEEYLFSIFKNVAEKMKNKKVIIRTLDIGGDKKCSYIDIPNEDNPFLGYRAIRYCLDNKDLFKTLLKAILRASNYGNILIMYPMISSLEDIIECNKVLEESKNELIKENKKFDNNIKVGVMVEIPSIAINAKNIIKYVDFYSIGTNDLVQYTLAVDRVNPSVSKYYNWFNPSVLKLIKNSIDASMDFKDKFTGMCGEFAADPLGLIILVGLGIDEFSVNLNSVGKVKKYISLLNYKETKEFVLNLIELDNSNEIEEKLDKYAKEKFGKYYF